MKLFELKVTIEVEDGYTDAELEAFCEDLDTADPEGIVYDALCDVLDNTGLGQALKVDKATMEVGEK
jgi:hypothetical protein